MQMQVPVQAQVQVQVQVQVRTQERIHMDDRGENDADDVDYGPLAGLIGEWRGDSGMDVSPEPDGEERSPYYETMVFEAAGDVDNAETQELAIVRYHLTVRRKSNDEIFHDQVGYWHWDADARVVMQTLAIPRAVTLVAGGSFDPSARSSGPIVLTVAAGEGSPGWPIAESPFMHDHARTVAYQHELTLDGERLRYRETTRLRIYDRSFDHTDENELTRR